MARGHLIELRRDTSANWNSVNPVLAVGEPGAETDTGQIKVGDGVSPWSGLPYVGSGGGAAWGTITGTVADQADLQSALDAKQPVGTYLSSASDVTAALGYIPTSITGLTGVQTTLAFKAGLGLVKADVGLDSVDNTSDAAKNVLSATKLTTPRTINGVAFDGTAAITISAVDATARVPTTRTITTTAPLTGGGDLSANRTLAISAATTAAAGSMSAADKAKLDAITGTNTGDQTSIVGITGTLAQFNTAITDGNIPVASADLSDGASLYKAGGVDVALADGGTGASTASVARTNLGLGTGSTLNISVGTTAPASPAVNDLWVDTN